MKHRLGLIAAVLVMSCGNARADAVGHLNWCWTSTGPPGFSEEWATLPDGTRRGPESARGLLLRAKTFMQQGNNDMAVSMAAHCQNHAPTAKAEILGAPAATLAFLARL